MLGRRKRKKRPDVRSGNARINRHTSANQSKYGRSAANVGTASPDTLDELLAIPPDRLDTCDIGRMNLLCATNLPGAESLGVDSFLNKLDEWTVYIDAMTRHNIHYFYEKPAEYDNSEAYWRILTLTTVLQLDFNIRHNMERIDKEDWSDSRDLFIHGLLGPQRTGTCPSIPALITAIGRRLKYPLRIVLAPGHVVG